MSRSKVWMFIMVPLMIIHLAVLYLWITDWKALVTPIGLASWLSSTAFGVVAYLAARRWQTGSLGRRALFGSTAVMIVLMALSLVIEVTTDSMP